MIQSSFIFFQLTNKFIIIIFETFSSTCNINCQCDYVKYSPICGSDGKTYISACHAGCRVSRTVNDSKIFEQCSCIPGEPKTISKRFAEFSIDYPTFPIEYTRGTNQFDTTLDVEMKAFESVGLSQKFKTV